MNRRTILKTILASIGISALPAIAKTERKAPEPDIYALTGLTHTEFQMISAKMYMKYEDIHLLEFNLVSDDFRFRDMKIHQIEWKGNRYRVGYTIEDNKKIFVRGIAKWNGLDA